MKQKVIYLNISKEEFEKEWNDSIKVGIIYQCHFKINKNKNETN